MGADSMDADHKKVLKSLSLELRHSLEGWYDDGGGWHAGDLEQRLNALGVWRDRSPIPVDELPHLSAADHPYPFYFHKCKTAFSINLEITSRGFHRLERHWKF